jgi:hypothetical protein
MGSVTKEQALSGVAHDIAHHAGSSFCCLMPHLAKALREASLKTTAVELLDEEPFPREFPKSGHFVWLWVTSSKRPSAFLRSTVLNAPTFSQSSCMEHQRLGMRLTTFCTLAP